MPTTNLGRIGLVPKGTWVAGTYRYLDLITYDGGAYVCAVPTTTQTPGTGSDWQTLVTFTDGVIDDTAVSTNTGWSSSKIEQAVSDGLDIVSVYSLKPGSAVYHSFVGDTDDSLRLLRVGVNVPYDVKYDSLDGLTGSNYLTYKRAITNTNPPEGFNPSQLFRKVGSFYWMISDKGISVSSDAKAWSNVISITGSYIGYNLFHYSGSKYAYSYDYDYLGLSNDGVNWDTPYLGVEHSAGLGLASDGLGGWVSSGGINVVFSTDDGVSWATRTPPNYGGGDCIYHNGAWFVAHADSTSSSTVVLSKSTDYGQTWTQTSVYLGGNNIGTVRLSAHADTLVVAARRSVAGSSTMRIFATSTDGGATLTAVDFYAQSSSGSTLPYVSTTPIVINGVFYAITDENRLYRSTDGLNWTFKLQGADSVYERDGAIYIIAGSATYTSEDDGMTLTSFNPTTAGISSRDWLTRLANSLWIFRGTDSSGANKVFVSSSPNMDQAEELKYGNDTSYVSGLYLYARY